MDEISKSKILIDKEEITGDDLRFIHELKDNFKHLGVTTKDCAATISKLMESFNNPIKGEKMNIMKNVYFGPCGDRAKISHLGIAVKNFSGLWVSYDKASNEIVDVDLISFGNGNYVYMIPVALKDIAVGDAVAHNGHIMFVKAVKSDGLRVIDVTEGEEKKILPTKSIFGFDFVTKVVSLIDFSGIAANEDNPFGNILPFLLLSGMNDKEPSYGHSKKENDALPLALMMLNGQNSAIFKDSNSAMMMAILMNNGETGSSMSNLLPLMMLMNQNKNGGNKDN